MTSYQLGRVLELVNRHGSFSAARADIVDSIEYSQTRLRLLDEVSLEAAAGNIRLTVVDDNLAVVTEHSTHEGN